MMFEWNINKLALMIGHRPKLIIGSLSIWTNSNFSLCGLLSCVNMQKSMQLWLRCYLYNGLYVCVEYCPSGQQMTSSGCQACPRGYYRHLNDGLFVPCTMCDPEYITASTGATSISQCNVGTCKHLFTIWLTPTTVKSVLFVGHLIWVFYG